MPPTSLEEFLYACRENNLFPLLQYRDKTMLEIAKGIIGDKMILYNGDHSIFDGFVITHHSFTTKEEILAQCEKIGRPYIYSMANPGDFTDEQLIDIVNALHKAGYYIHTSSAYTSKQAEQRCRKFGFDSDTVSLSVNTFEEGNLATLVSSDNYSDFTTEGTVENGVLSLNTGEYVHTDQYSGGLLKYCIKVMFNGNLKIDNYDITSDGMETIIVTGFRVNDSRAVWIIANAATEIYMLKIVVSKC